MPPCRWESLITYAQLDRYHSSSVGYCDRQCSYSKKIRTFNYVHGIGTNTRLFRFYQMIDIRPGVNIEKHHLIA